MAAGGVKGRGINGGDPLSGEAAVYAAKALDPVAATTLCDGAGLDSTPHPLPRGERGVWGGPQVETWHLSY